MDKLKRFTLVMGASLLLAACGGTLDNNSSGTESGSETIESVESIEESQASESSEQESAVESSVEESESSSEVASDTQLNQDEAEKIERAKAKLTELTGLEEGEEFLYMIEGVEGQIVTINIRENGEDVSSSRGFFKYDDETGNVQELDIVTGEYVDFPANP